MKIGEAVYKAQQEAAGEAAAEADAQDEENIVDADFEKCPKTTPTTKSILTVQHQEPPHGKRGLLCPAWR